MLIFHLLITIAYCKEGHVMGNKLISITLNQELNDYLKHRAAQKECKTAEIVRELIREDQLKKSPGHTDIMESLCKITGDIQKIKRRTKNGFNIGKKEIEKLESEVQFIWEKL